MYLVRDLGNDSLVGGAGNDAMAGGAGDDIYIVDAIGDIIAEAAGAGLDTVSSTVTYSLAAPSAVGIDDLTLTGSTAINGTGNDIDNTITGNSANNILDGGLGNDILDGGLGNDNLIGGAGADRFQLNGFGAAVGVDSINDFTVGLDKLVLNRTAFGLTSVAGNGFSVTTEFASVVDDETAQTSAARIIFSQESNGLFYNTDGATAGFGTGGLFTEVIGATTLAATDFIIA